MPTLLLVLVCTTFATSPYAQRFTVFDPLGVKPRISIEDAALMDPPEDTPDVREMSFSNGCENSYGLRLDRATLDDPTSKVTGTLEYWDQQMPEAWLANERPEETVQVICNRKP